jgi:hypothetical protein
MQIIQPSALSPRAAPSLPPLHERLLANGAVGLVLARVEGGWQASVEMARGSYRDGPVAGDADAALAGALQPLVTTKLPEMIPPPPMGGAILPPPY